MLGFRRVFNQSRISFASQNARLKSSVLAEAGMTPKDFGLASTLKVLCFGSGAVTNTLMALFKRSDNVDLILQSRYADHVVSNGVKLLHSGDEIAVPKSDIKVIKDPRHAVGYSPTVIINGRQLGGNYDEIFDACGQDTEYIMCAQNGFSSQALYRASQDYIARNPGRADIIKNIVGVDMSMFVKMSGTEEKHTTILQPGAKWVFGAFELADGSGTGTGGSAEVSSTAFEKVTNFVDWFRALGPADGKDDMADVKAVAETVTGKLLKTSNNIGGNYAAAILTRYAHLASQKTLAAKGAMKGPLAYGVLNENYDFENNVGHLMSAEALDEFSDQVAYVRKLSLNAVSEFYDLYEDQFSKLMDKEQVLEAAKLYWTEMDPAGQRIPSKHPPTHALAMFEGRPSEPLLEDILSLHPADKTMSLQALQRLHHDTEKRQPLPISLKKEVGDNWLESAAAHNVRAKSAQGSLDKLGLMKIVSYHFVKPDIPQAFSPELADIGEHAISYMERVGQFKAYYESLEVSPGEYKEPFVNLTIGGVYRVTPPRVNAPQAHRGYVTHLTHKDKTILSQIMASLGVDLTPEQVNLAPMRAKLALQQVLLMFEPGVVVAHSPTYASTTDSARTDAGHEVVSVPVQNNRFFGLFDEVKAQALAPENEGKPIILLLLDPHNPSAIGMTKEEEDVLAKLVQDHPNVNVVHDFAYQGYHRGARDYAKVWRDEGMPHASQTYIGILSTSKSVFASGQPAIYTADKNSMPFIEDHYQRMGTGPTSTFVHDLEYYFDTLDGSYMPAVEDNLQRPLMDFVDANMDRWGVKYLMRPDGPPFITLDITEKMAKLGVNSKGFREITLRMGAPMLVSSGMLRVSLTGFDKSQHEAVLPVIKQKLDDILSLDEHSELVAAFKEANPIYSK